MPTFNIRKVRKLLKSGKAQITGYHPFTVKLLYAESLHTQPAEVCVDAGDKHIGISVKSEKHEYVHAQYDPLPDEKQRHDDCRKARRLRRNRLRCRKPRFDNRKREDGWLAPSLQHKKELHISLVEKYRKVCPVAFVTVETASFDTQLLEAMERGLPVPEGTDYQRGPRYKLNTLRDAVFFRDGHRCLLCGAEGKPLRMHHIGFWKGDRSDRMGNLASLCTDCHSPANHKPGGKLYGREPKIKPLTGAAFMNSVRKQIAAELKEAAGLPVKTTCGSATKTARKTLCVEKSHANDAFCMGDFHPKHRQPEAVFRKRRRNNRILERFYDAKYIDLRDGKKKPGQELSCGRTRRCEPGNTNKNLRIFRGRKVSKGRRQIRREHYRIRPGTLLLHDGKRVNAKGVHCRGIRVLLDTGKSVAVSKVTVVSFPGSWECIS